MTPPRLLCTTQNGFERDLLASAALDRAPLDTRARVRQSVAQALAGTRGGHASDSYLSDSYLPDNYLPDNYLPDNYLPDSVRPDNGGPNGDPSQSASETRDAWGGGQPRVRGLQLKVCLGMLALAASGALVLRHGALQRELTAQGAPGSCALPDAVAGYEPARGALASAGGTRSLASTPAGVPFQSGEAPPLAPPGAEDASDWLGAQLQLLGEARRQLELGSVEQAHGLLDRYEQRFPDGVLGPQISALRAELLHQQALAPRHNGTQLNLPCR